LSKPLLPFGSGDEAVEALPTMIRVNAFDFKIEKWKPAVAERAHRYAECSTVDQIIRIRTDLSSPEKAADTLLHELSHAIWWAHGVDDADAEERTVNLTCTAWTAIYRNNPWLLEWLARCLNR
jgi:hypothetical protein